MSRTTLLLSIAIVGVMTTIGLLCPPTSALTINLKLSESSESPPFDVDGTKLTDLMRAAANMWEDIIEDSHTVDIEYYWADLPVPGRTSDIDREGPDLTSATIRFDSDIRDPYENPTLWFIDDSPYDNGEYYMWQTLYDELSSTNQQDFFTGSPPGLLKAGFGGSAKSSAPDEARHGFDLLSVAMHEIAHALAINDVTHGGGDYLVPTQFVGGNNMAIMEDDDNHYHLRDDYAAMYFSAIPRMLTSRTLPSATDVFAVAAAADWTQIDLPRKDFLTGSSWHTPGNWEGNRVPDGGDDAYIRHGGTVITAGDAYVKNLFVGRWIAPYSTLQLTTGTLRADSVALADAGFVLLDSGTLIATSQTVAGHFIQTGGRNTASGSIVIAALPVKGIYDLRGGSLFTGTLEVGHGGDGDFNWTGGTLTAFSVTVGSGGTMTVGVNWTHDGLLDIEGGRVDLGAYKLTLDIGGNGSLGAGELAATHETIGLSGWGNFIQTGGTNSVSGSVVLGVHPGSTGTYNLEGGSLFTGRLEIGGTGSFNWTGGTLAAEGIDVEGTMTVSDHWTYDGVLTIAAGTVDLEQHKLRLDNGGAAVLMAGELNTTFETIGRDGVGAFLHIGGTNTVGGSLVIGAGPGSNGSYQLAGGNLTTDVIEIAAGGTGNFSWTGGTLSADTITVNTNGTLTVEQDWTYAGDLNISRGTVDLGSNDFDLDGESGFDGSTSPATASLSGSGRLSANNQRIGNKSTSAFTQSGGVNTVAENLYLGFDGQWRHYQCDVGDGDSYAWWGDGTYELSGTGELHVQNVYVGYRSQGHFFQTGGTHLVGGNLYLGYGGFTVEECWNVDPTTSDECVCNESWFPSEGSYTISSGTLSVADGVIEVGNRGYGEFLLDGGVVTAESIERGDETPDFSWTGGTLHVETFGTPAQPFNLVNDGHGTLSPGGSIGSTTVYGNYTQGPDAMLEIEFDGPAADLVSVTGNVDLDGTLSLRTLGKLRGPTEETPQLWYGDETRTIITAGGAIAGFFADPWAVGDELGYGVFLTDGGANGRGITYEDHAVKVDLLQAAPGDANGDRRVDFADIKVLLVSGLWNKTEDPGDPYIWPPTWTEGDFTGDGLVSFADIAALLSTGLWNQCYTNLVCGDTIQNALDIDAAPSTAVPEPTTVAMLAGALLALLPAIRRRNGGIFPLRHNRT